MPLNNLGTGLNKAAKVGGGGSLPDQSGNNGKFLKTDGTAALWETIPGGGDMLAANNLSDVDNTGTSRTNLGVAIGSDVQAYDADLAALAGLTSAADKGIQFTGSGTAATFDLTAFAKTILDDGNAATVRATIDVDQAGTDNSTNVSLSGSPNYLTIAGQVITRALIDLASHITGTLGLSNGGTGATTASAARSNLGLGSAAVVDTTALILVDGSQGFSSDFDAGSINLTSLRFTSDQATGTAPYSASSTTLCANLNADLLDGQEGSYYRDADNVNAGTLSIARTSAVSRRHQIRLFIAGDDIAVGQPLVAYVRIPWKCTVITIGHEVDAATSVTWNLEERATRASAGTNVFTSDEVSTTTYQEETSGFANTGLAADGWLVLDISGVSGTPTQLLIEVEVEVDTDAS